MNLFCGTHGRDDDRYIVEFYSAIASIQCNLAMCSLQGDRKSPEKFVRCGINIQFFHFRVTNLCHGGYCWFATWVDNELFNVYSEICK